MTRLRTLLGGLAVFVAASALSVAPAFAQATTGEITGRVLDSTGTAVPGATVVARNEETGFTRSITTNATGEYTLTQLPPGRYMVSAELAGFKKAVRKDVEVNVGTRLTLGFDLAVGQVTEAVEVIGEAPLIETTKSDISGVVTPAEIQGLPMLNRTFAGLSIIMPEARPTGNFDPTKTRIGNFAMSGGDGRQLDVNVDGGDNKDNVVGSLIQNFAYEGIQEFQVLQHRWTAESGRAVGGVVNVITKSGTNQFRGTAFGSYREDGTRAKDFFEKQRVDNPTTPLDESAKAPFERKEFGGSLGGPIIKDKLFFFGAIERFKEDQNVIVSTAALAQIQAIPGAQPAAEIAQPYEDTLLTFKIDHRISDRQSMFYRFSYQDQSVPNSQIASPASTDLTGGNSDTTTNYDFVLNHTLSVSANKLNQFSFHFQDFHNEILNLTSQPILDFPTVDVGPNANTPQATLEKKYQFRNDFSWQTGNHGMKLGANYIYTKLDGYFYFGARGYTLAWFDDPVTIATNRTPQGTPASYPQGFATPGAVRSVTFSDGEASHVQNIHQIAFYLQDDWKVNRKLTLNLGLRWDANIGILNDQTNNRTIEILRQLNEPRAQAITSDSDKLSRSTPGWKEFQPRIGFAYDPRGDGRMVIRGGYGVFYDQLFQNLTLFSLSQSGGAEIFATLLNLTNSAVGVGQLANYRFGVDPLPAAPLPSSQLPTGGFGRINDPDFEDPYVQKFSIGFQKTLGRNWSISSDYVHTLGIHEPRVQVINPRIENICNQAYAGSTPNSPRCVRGINSRYFDQAFVAAGLPANRLEQINMIGGTNRSLFDSWTSTLRGRVGKSTVSLSYVLASSRGWGAQPTASYSGNGIATTPENQFRDGEFGATRNDERHRVVASAVLELPLGFQFAPIVQFATSRPYSPTAGFDLDGDGLSLNDRLCANTSLDGVFAVRGDLTKIRPLNPLGCTQAQAGSQRGGFIVDANGNVSERSGRYLNVDLRVTKTFAFADRLKFKVYVDMYNLFNTENLAFTDRVALSAATAGSRFLQPVALFGPGFGPPVGRPFTAVFGARFEF